MRRTAGDGAGIGFEMPLNGGGVIAAAEKAARVGDVSDLELRDGDSIRRRAKRQHARESRRNFYSARIDGSKEGFHEAL